MQHLVSIVIIAAVVAWAVYRRIRRTIGFQRLSDRSLYIRCAIMIVLGGLVVVTGFAAPVTLIGDAIGVVAGIALAYAAAGHLVFEKREDGWYYRTHAWVEAVVLILFIGRLAYRFVEVFSASGRANGFQTVRDPVTAGALFSFVTYYIALAVVLLRRSRRLASDDMNRPDAHPTDVSSPESAPAVGTKDSEDAVPE